MTTPSRKAEFEKWLAKVDAEVVKLSGIGIDDIPDFDYWDCFDAGETPRECANEALYEANFPFDEETN